MPACLPPPSSYDQVSSERRGGRERGPAEGITMGRGGQTMCVCVLVAIANLLIIARGLFGELCLSRKTE